MAVSCSNSCGGSYAQHDSQEFLQRTLEGLHADLNQKQPELAEAPEPGIEPGTEADQAVAAWQHLCSSNDSVIEDLFGGFLQSTMVCEGCGGRSLGFESSKMIQA